MTPRIALLTRLYEAYNKGDFDAFAAELDPAVDWPDQIGGGRILGVEAMRAFWTRRDGMVRVEAAPMDFTVLKDGRIAVATNQTVHNLEGRLWSDSRVRHIYTFQDGRVSRMDIVEYLDEA
ncbi:nuclear transport factor 2 family protein [Caulobacter endophyticus]|uniref:nuclear transport factor 2 family protein n=1 Tax=Caulobacter endophyticus TaxID=2172652 RepID=UPI0024102840|nr:nuclear transport factor 2 family protein [Caulobacter endophyticus]MDG2528696.1 nuclear transport factor 2 family protein [Caulobacter endophyticus]